ncbi:MAG: uroporphyrinogen-III synthase [Burkholderiaceae bacterium]|nr:uroporphyrinogen-III synthase [Burkholderiaceae bacterium]
MAASPAQARVVVITRPLAQAEQLAERIRLHGREAVLFPLLEIQALADSAALRAALSRIAEYTLVAFVSPNAIDAALAHISQWPPGVALAVMGEGSMAALARHGLSDANATIFRPRDPDRTDSETLLEALDIAAVAGGQVLIVRGESGRELLADRLREHGAIVTQVAAYRRTAPALTEERARQLHALIEQKNLWLITSSEALRNLDAMVRQLDDPACVVKMQQQTIFAPHARIAESGRELGFIDIVQTGSGDENLLKALSAS